MVSVRRKGPRRKIMLDHLIERRAGRPVPQEELERVKMSIAQELRRISLASGIQTGDLRRGLRLADRIHAGTVWLNTLHKYHPNAPFGGYKMSGYGRENRVEALESYTQYKSI
jgi:acyl-CoA reductase-like NAD-dependent aldehyde dehydrogenase